MLLQKLPRVLQILQVVLEHGLRDLGLGLLSDHLAEVGLIAMLEGGGPLRESWACWLLRLGDGSSIDWWQVRVVRAGSPLADVADKVGCTELR